MHLAGTSKMDVELDAIVERSIELDTRCKNFRRNKSELSHLRFKYRSKTFVTCNYNATIFSKVHSVNVFDFFKIECPCGIVDFYDQLPVIINATNNTAYFSIINNKKPDFTYSIQCLKIITIQSLNIFPLQLKI